MRLVSDLAGLFLILLISLLGFVIYGSSGILVGGGLALTVWATSIASYRDAESSSGSSRFCLSANHFVPLSLPQSSFTIIVPFGSVWYVFTDSEAFVD